MHFNESRNCITLNFISYCNDLYCYNKLAHVYNGGPCRDRAETVNPFESSSIDGINGWKCASGES